MKGMTLLIPPYMTSERSWCRSGGKSGMPWNVVLFRSVRRVHLSDDKRVSSSKPEQRSGRHVMYKCIGSTCIKPGFLKPNTIYKHKSCVQNRRVKVIVRVADILRTQSKRFEHVTSDALFAANERQLEFRRERHHARRRLVSFSDRAVRYCPRHPLHVLHVGPTWPLLCLDEVGLL
jgi:hypothetical protein